MASNYRRINHNTPPSVSFQVLPGESITEPQFALTKEAQVNDTPLHDEKPDLGTSNTHPVDQGEADSNLSEASIEGPSDEPGPEATHTSTRRKKLTKSEITALIETLANDINDNGPRHPLEYARQYQITTYMAIRLIAQASLKELIKANETAAYDVKKAQKLPSWLRDLMGLDEDALVRIDYDQSALMLYKI